MSSATPPPPDLPSSLDSAARSLKPAVPAAEVEAEPGARRSGRHGNRSGSRRRFGNTQRTVPAGVAMGHSLLLALSASMVVIGAAGVLEWRDDDFLNLVIGASFLMGMQVMYLVQKYLRWRKKQRDRQALKAVG